MKRILPFFLLVFSVIGFEMKANTFAGGEITYASVGQDSIVVTLTLYKDCKRFCSKRRRY